MRNKKKESLLSLEEEEKKEKPKRKMSKKKKIIIGVTSGFVCFLFTFYFLFYGPWDGFRNFWITTAMTTMNHRYLATCLYSEETIQKVLASNSVIEPDGSTNTSLIKFTKYKKTTIYKNEYEKQILDRDPDVI